MTILNGGRLTLTSSTPVTTSDVTAATTIYHTPVGPMGNRISVYNDNYGWIERPFTEVSVAVPSTIYRLFDVFGYDNAGTWTLETVNWNQSTASITGATNASPIVITSNGHGLSNGDRVGIVGVGGNTAANGVWSIANITANTFELAGSTGNGAYTSGGTWYKLNATRATALAIQNGVYVKTGTLIRKYLGTGMTTDTSGQIESSSTKRLLWNYYNRVLMSMRKDDTTNHTYTGTGVRIYRDVISNKVEFVIGVDEDAMNLATMAEFNFDAGDGTVFTGYGTNSTGAFTESLRVADVFDARYMTTVLMDNLGNINAGIGHNFLQLLEQGAATSPDFRRGFVRAEIKG